MHTSCTFLVILPMPSICNFVYTSSTMFTSVCCTRRCSFSNFNSMCRSFVSETVALPDKDGWRFTLCLCNITLLMRTTMTHFVGEDQTARNQNTTEERANNTLAHFS